MIDCVSFCARVEGCNGCVPTDSYFKALVLEGLCCISQGGGGGGGVVSPAYQKLCDACVADTFIQISGINNNGVPLQFRASATAQGGDFQNLCEVLSNFTIYWGDGSSSVGNTTTVLSSLPTHLYAQPGQYVIEFRLLWQNGSVDSMYLPIVVTAAATTSLSALPLRMNMRKGYIQECFIRRFNADGTVTDLTLAGAPYVVSAQVSCECPVFTTSVVGSPTLPSQDDNLLPAATTYTQLPVTAGAAVTLTPPAGARGATLQLQEDTGTGPARFRVDGVAPTNTSGFFVDINGTIRLGALANPAANASELSTFSIISTTGNTHILAVQFYF